MLYIIGTLHVESFPDNCEAKIGRNESAADALGRAAAMPPETVRNLLCPFTVKWLERSLGFKLPPVASIADEPEKFSVGDEFLTYVVRRDALPLFRTVRIVAAE